MYDHTFYKQVQISRSDIRRHIKWAVSLAILHMVTSIFLRALCGKADAMCSPHLCQERMENVFLSWFTWQHARCSGLTLECCYPYKADNGDFFCRDSQSLVDSGNAIQLYFGGGG